MTSLFKLLLFGLPYFWLVGLVLPALYLLYLLSISKCLTCLVRKDTYCWIILVALLIQLLSVFLSFFQDYFSIERLVAIAHNISAFSFLLLGYSLAYFDKTRSIVLNSIKGVFLFIAFTSLLSFAYSITKSEYIDYTGLLGYFSGVENDFTAVIINQQGWLAGFEFPRSRVMSVFPNNSAILLLVTYIILVTNFDFSFLRRIFLGLLLIGATITTGSRNGILLSMALVVVQLIRGNRILALVILLMPFFMFGVLAAVEFLTDLRKDSNETRFELYWDSIIFSFSHNPILGLGLKPKIPEIGGGDLPIGSHSTLLGYFVKNGLVGGIYFLLIYMGILFQAILRIGSPLFKKTAFSQRGFVLNVGMIFLLATLLFDDLDAFETVPFYMGFLLFFFHFKTHVNPESRNH